MGLTAITVCLLAFAAAPQTTLRLSQQAQTLASVDMQTRQHASCRSRDAQEIV